MTKQTTTTTKTTKAATTKKAAAKAPTEKTLDLTAIRALIGAATPVSEMYVKEGFNIRDIDSEQVDSLAEPYKAGRKVPPIVVKIDTDGKLQVIDGHHRYLAAVSATLKTVNTDEFEGDSKEETAFMITSSQGRNLTPLQRAGAYERLIKDGATKTDIHKITGRSRTDIDRHLLLLEASTPVKKALQDGKVGLKAVVQELKRGEDAATASRHIMNAVKAAGGHSVTTTGMNKYNKSLGIKPEITPEEQALIDAENEKKAADTMAAAVAVSTAAKEEAISGWTAKDTTDVMEILSGFEDSWLTSVNPELAKLVAKWTA